MRAQSGFTLAEVLIALALLGIVAGFTIPKVLQSSSTQHWRAIEIEAAAMVAEAYEKYQQNHRGPVPTTMTMFDLLPYMNTVGRDTTTRIDWTATQDYRDCSDTTNQYCVRLYNGAIMRFALPTGLPNGVNNIDFSNNNTPLSAIEFEVDPNGTYSGSVNGADKAVQFLLYYDGQIRSRGTAIPDSWVASTDIQPIPAYDPDWFYW